MLYRVSETILNNIKRKCTLTGATQFHSGAKKIMNPTLHITLLRIIYVRSNTNLYCSKLIMPLFFSSLVI